MGDCAKVEPVYGPIVDRPVGEFAGLALGEMAADGERNLPFCCLSPMAVGQLFSLRFSFVYDSPKSTDGVFIERAVHLRAADVPMEVDREIDFYVRFVLAFDDIHKTVDGGDEFLARSTFRVVDEQCPELNEPAFVSGGQHLVNKAFPFDPYAHELSRPLEQQQLLLDGTR